MLTGKGQVSLWSFEEEEGGADGEGGGGLEKKQGGNSIDSGQFSGWYWGHF